MSEDNLTEEAPTVLFRPSYSATFLNCEAALLDGRFYPDSAGQEAAVGTVFHNIMDEWLKTGRKPYYRLGEIAEIWRPDADREKDKPFYVEIDEDMFYYGQQCIDFIKQFKGKRYTERRVDISHLTPIPDQSGTLDLAFLSMKRRKAVIIDWKYGTGVKVFAEWNTQELLYLSGIFEEFDFIYDFQDFELWIAQPRLKHWDKFTLTRAQLIEWMNWAKIRMQGSWKRKGRTYTVGVKQCTWCKRRDDCRARLAALERIADESFDMVVTPKQAKEVVPFEPPKSMETTILRLSTEELSRIYEYRKLFENWFKRIGERLLEAGLDGADIGNFEIVKGREFRHWKNEKEAAKKFLLFGIDRDDMFVHKMKSPNQMAKIMRAAKIAGMRGKALDDYLESMVDRVPGKPTLTRKGEDEREAIDVDYFESD